MTAKSSGWADACDRELAKLTKKPEAKKAEVIIEPVQTDIEDASNVVAMVKPKKRKPRKAAK